jgi:DNA-directed RNA polymerase specialized sigma24 family protein
MSQEKKGPPLDVSNAPPSEAASSPSDVAPRPSVGAEPPKAGAAAPNKKPPLADPGGDPNAQVTRADLMAYVGRRDTQEHVRHIVLARIDEKTPADDVNELVQRANYALVGSKSLPRVRGTMRGWLGTVVVRAVVHTFREGVVDLKWLNREVVAEDQAAEPVDDPLDDGWLISKWLAPLAAENEADQETYELIRYIADKDTTHKQAAADHGMSEQALKNRIARLKKKYAPRWRRRRNTLVALWSLAALVVVAVLVKLLWPAAKPVVPIGPDPDRLPLPAPSAAPSASREPFNQADPTDAAPAPTNKLKP